MASTDGLGIGLDETEPEVRPLRNGRPLQFTRTRHAAMAATCVTRGRHGATSCDAHGLNRRVLLHTHIVLCTGRHFLCAECNNSPDDSLQVDSEWLPLTSPADTAKDELSAESEGDNEV